MAAFAASPNSATLRAGAGGNDEDRATVQLVSGNYFEVLGASAADGRPLAPDDDRVGAAPVAVLSDHFWRERLGADPRVVGRVISLNDTGFMIVGVMPASFFGARVARAPGVWLPLVWQPQIQRDLRFFAGQEGTAAHRPDYYWLSLIGRLADGQTLQGAGRAATTVLRQFLTAQMPHMQGQTPDRIRTAHITTVDGARGISPVRARSAQLLALLLAAVGVILLIACANVGTLLFARAAAREREIAVRRALGAGRGRLVRQWLTESALLAVLSAVCGVGVARLVAPTLLATFVPANVPVTVTLDLSVLAFTTGIAAAACVLFGLTPAWQAGRVDPVRSLRLSGPSLRRRHLLGLAEPFVVAQIAMSLVLVVAATLLVRTLLNLEAAPVGFDRDRVLLVPINPRPAAATPLEHIALYRRLYDRLRALPGIEQLTLARYSPFEGSTNTTNATIDGYIPAPGEHVDVETIAVGPQYPATLGMPLSAGRAFTPDDRVGSPRVAMVNEAFVRRYLPAASAIGRHFQIRNHEDYEIVGVLQDAAFHSVRDPAPPTVFTAILQDTYLSDYCEIELGTRAAAGAMAEPVRQAIADVDAKVQIGNLRTLRGQVLATFGAERTAAGFILAFAVLALLVAAVGLYGVVSHGLARRTNEIGVRLALGAARVDIVRLVARETLLRLAVGLAVGAVLARSASSLIASQLFGVTPGDPLSLSLAAGVLAAVVVLATLRPTMRAMRVDPVTALRAE